MSRPPLEVADLVQAAGNTFIERSRKWITWKHVKVLLAIARCRTAALGGHLDECTRCGHRAISYNSCRNRHCPKCQAGARERWLEKRRRELLPTQYVHVVFTLPRHLAPLVLQNKKLIYDLLFRTSAETLLEMARDPQHLGAEIGFFSVLHTWSQKLDIHPHVHCVVPAGGLSLDHTHWLVSFAEGRVTFRWRDSAHYNEHKLMTLSLDEFLRRFLLHLLPEGFVRIRNFGFLANRKRATTLPLCFQLLSAAPQTEQEVSTAAPSDLWFCPKCGGTMMVVERLTAAEIQLRSPPVVTAAA